MFKIIALICLSGMQPQECSPVLGYSRDMAVLGKVSNEIECLQQSQQVLGKVESFQNLADGEYIKIMCVRS